MTKDTAMARQSVTALEQQYDNDRYNYLAPKMMLTELPPGMRLVATQVDVNPMGDDVYPIPGGPKVGISKPKLNQLAAGAGITWLHSRRVDDRRHPWYCEWEVGGRMVMPDGTVREETAGKTIDMREDIGDGKQGADLTATAGKVRQILAIRQNITSLAETKAKNRLIRSMIGLKTGYQKQDLGRPFIMIKMAVDPSSELGGRAAMAAMYGATDALFGPPAAEPAKVIDSQFEEVEPVSHENAQIAETLTAPPEAEVMDPDTGEISPADESPLENLLAAGHSTIIVRVRELWAYAKSKGMDGGTFKKIGVAATGKEKKEDFVWADTVALAERIEAWAANQQDEDLPL